MAELERVEARLRKDLEAKLDRRYRQQQQPQPLAISGKDLVDWLISNNLAKCRSTAVEIGRGLIFKNLIKDGTSAPHMSFKDSASTIYRLVSLS